MASRTRTVKVARKTRETDITVRLNLDGGGSSRLRTGLPFFEHMLSLLAAHGLFDLDVAAAGDLEVDQHHLVEDLGLTLGQALLQAVRDKRGLARYGSSLLPMDESLVMVALDFSGRPYLAYGLSLRQKRLSGFDTELVPEFLRALAQSAGLTLHVVQMAGGNTHHLLEAAFKALGRALRAAVTRDRRVRGIPSTKGRL